MPGRPVLTANYLAIIQIILLLLLLLLLIIIIIIHQLSMVFTVIIINPPYASYESTVPQDPGKILPREAALDE